MEEWDEKSVGEIVEINLRETIKRGTVAKKVAMDKLQPFCRDILGFELEPFSGGTKFRNGDTVMARITPCLENGKQQKSMYWIKMKLVLDRRYILFSRSKDCAFLST